MASLSGQNLVLPGFVCFNFSNSRELILILFCILLTVHDVKDILICFLAILCHFFKHFVYFLIDFFCCPLIKLLEKAMAPRSVLLPGEPRGWRSLEGCSPWGRWGSDMTERLHFHFSLSCIGEGNGNPLQWSCLENPRDGGAWWAAIYGVTQSRTRLKWLSSSSSSIKL